MVEKDDVNVFDLIKTMCSKKHYILGITVLFVVAMSAYVTKRNNDIKTVSMVVSLGWSEIEYGQYPNQEMFKYNDLIDSEVIIETNKKFNSNNSDLNVLDGKIAVDMVKSSIDVTPIINSSVQEVVNNKKEVGEEYNHVQTSYEIKLDFQKLGFSEEEGKEYLCEMFYMFTDLFKKKYIDEKILNILPQEIAHIERLEYYDIKEFLSNQVVIIENALEENLDEIRSYAFISEYDSKLEELKVELNLIKSIYVRPIIGLIDGYALTKDKTIIKRNYESRLSESILKKEQYENEKLEQQILLDNYIQNVMIASNGEVIGSIATSDLYEELVEIVMDLNTKIAEISTEIKICNTILATLESENDETVNDIEKSVVDNLIPNANEKLNKIIYELEEIITENKNSNIQNSIQLMPQVEGDLSKIKYIGVAVIAGLFTGSVLVILLNAYKEDQKSKDKNHEI